MDFGLVPVNVGVGSVEKMLEVGQLAERIGFESLWTFEHVIVPMEYASKYPYSPDGKMGVTPETNFVDPLIALTALAARTERIKLATGVNILSQSNPLYLAKQAASLDFVSNGRFLLGLGIGWLREEFEALGAPYERRGARFDDYVQAMRKVWSGDVVEHQSDFVSWSGFKSYPLPKQNPLPIIIGGDKGKALERVARYGDGWFVPSGNVEKISGLLKGLDEACAAVGRDRSSVEVTAMWIPPMDGIDAVARYEDLGVSRAVVPVFALGPGDPMETVQRFADDTLSKLI